MRQSLSILILFLSFSLSLTAQEGNWCGTANLPEWREALQARLLNNLQTVEEGVVGFRETLYVPVKFHLAARNDGTGRISEVKVLDQLCELNEDFGPHDIQFFLADGTFHYINNTTLYENHIVTQNSVMQPQRDTRAMNIWIVETVDDGSGPGVTLAYYHTIRDWIVIRKANIKGNDATLSHEVGHFFSLLHTFNGWESESYLTENVPAPFMSSGGAVPTEFVDRTNCNTAGDFICDTPEDYGFGFGWSNCNFTLNILDPHSDLCDPDESNMLSYFLNCPDGEYHFSDMQVEAMRASFNSNFHAYLSIDAVPDVVEINEMANPIYPTGGEIAQAYNYIELEWDAVEGASSYLVELSRVSGFTVNPIRVVTSETGMLLEDLLIDKKYYWRVRPFNAHNVCMSASVTTSFETGTTDISTAVNNAPAFVNAFLISPNPVHGEAELNIVLELDESIEGTLRMVDITGRIVQNVENKTFAKGENQTIIETTNLTNGIYLLQFETSKGQITKKVVIAN